MSDPVAILKDAYRKWEDSRGAGVDDWLSICAPDAHIGSIGDGQPDVEYSAGGVGLEAVRRFLVQLNADWEMIENDMHDFIHEGGRVVALGHATWRHRASGRTVSTRKCDIWRFRDDKVTDFYEFYDTAAVRGLS